MSEVDDVGAAGDEFDHVLGAVVCAVGEWCGPVGVFGVHVRLDLCFGGACVAGVELPRNGHVQRSVKPPGYEPGSGWLPLLPAKDSNLDFLIQNQASCQLDEQGRGWSSAWPDFDATRAGSSTGHARPR